MKPFPGVGCSPQTIGSRDATEIRKFCQGRWKNIQFQSPNYRVTRCNLLPDRVICGPISVSVPKLSGHAMQPKVVLARPPEVVLGFSPQTIGSRDATIIRSRARLKKEDCFSPQTIGSRDATDPYPFLLHLILPHLEEMGFGFKTTIFRRSIFCSKTPPIFENLKKGKQSQSIFKNAQDFTGFFGRQKFILQVNFGS